MYSLRVLLTATERRKPWILFFTPGLLLSEVLRIAYTVLFMDPLRLVILPRASSEDASPFQNITFIRFSFYILLAVISTAIICPLEVISTRLSIQRNHDSPGFSTVSQEEEVNEVVYSASDEDVIGYVTTLSPSVLLFLTILFCASGCAMKTIHILVLLTVRNAL